MRPGPVIRTAGGGRSFPPARGGGKFPHGSALDVLRVVDVVLPVRAAIAWRPPPVRSLFAMIIARSRGALTVKSMVKSKERKPGRRARGGETGRTNVSSCEREQETHTMVRTASGHTRTALTLEFQ